MHNHKPLLYPTAGIGFATWMIGFYTNLYYNAIIMWTIYYFVASINKSLPWADECPEEGPGAECCTNTTRASHYWYYEALNISSDINDSGDINWKMTLSLLAAWVTCFLCMVKGIKTSGKVVYVTAIFPFMALIGLFIMSLTLQGSSEGIKYFFDPTYVFTFEDKNTTRNVTSNWDQLKNPYCWLEAASQIFYSLSLGFGSCIAFASYNPTKTDFYKQTIGISIVNSLSSMLAGVTIFAIIGSSAVKNQIPIDELSTGPGLAFIAVSEAIATTPAAPLWSAMFFLMLFMLGIDSQFAGIEETITQEPTDTTKQPIRTRYLGHVTGYQPIRGQYFLPLSFSRNGLYIVDLFDNFSANFPLMMVAFCEVTAVSWVYGINRFCRDFENMTGYYPNIVWRALWVVITPLSILTILLYSLIDQLSNPIQYEQFVGCMSILSTLPSETPVPTPELPTSHDGTNSRLSPPSRISAYTALMATEMIIRHHGYITGTRSRNNSPKTAETLLRRPQDVAHLNSPFGVQMTGAAVDELKSITHPPGSSSNNGGSPRAAHGCRITASVRRGTLYMMIPTWTGATQAPRRTRTSSSVLHAPETCPRVHTGLNPDLPKPRNSSHFRVAGTSGPISDSIDLSNQLYNMRELDLSLRDQPVSAAGVGAREGECWMGVGFCRDFENMTGYYPNIVWRALWVVITPLSILTILLYSLIDQLSNPIQYEQFVGCMVSATEDGMSGAWTQTSNYPAWGWGLAFILVFSSFLFIPIMAVLAYLPKFFGPKYEIDWPLVLAQQEKKEGKDVEMREAPGQMPFKADRRSQNMLTGSLLDLEAPSRPPL
eukprot:sb/3462096/